MPTAPSGFDNQFSSLDRDVVQFNCLWFLASPMLWKFKHCFAAL